MFNKRESVTHATPMSLFFAITLPIIIALFCLRFGELPDEVAAAANTNANHFVCLFSSKRTNNREIGDLVLYAKEKKPSLFPCYYYEVGTFVCGEGEMPRDAGLDGDWKYDESWTVSLEGESLDYVSSANDDNPLRNEGSSVYDIKDKGIVPEGYICVTTGTNTIGLVPIDTIWGFPKPA